MRNLKTTKKLPIYIFACMLLLKYTFNIVKFKLLYVLLFIDVYSLLTEVDFSPYIFLESSCSGISHQCTLMTIFLPIPNQKYNNK